MTRYHCCPTSDGSAAAVLMSEKAVRERGLEHQAVEILAQAMTSDMPGTRDPETTKLVIFLLLTFLFAMFVKPGIGIGALNNLTYKFSAKKRISYYAA